MEMPRCCRCKYWIRKDNLEHGVCEMIADTIVGKKPVCGDAIISIQISSDIHKAPLTDFLTHANFGCVLHKS